MKSIGPFFAIFTAFVGGAFFCTLPVLNGNSANPNYVIPDHSVIPKSETESVEAAYAAIPHPRTSLPSHLTSAIPGSQPAESLYIRLMFDLTEQAIVARSGAVQHFDNGLSIVDYIGAFDELIHCAEQIKAPSSLASYHAIMSKVITNQRQALQRLHRNSIMGSTIAGFDLTHLAEVQTSSVLIQSAESQLWASLPNANEDVRSAFADLHSALDFVQGD